MMIWRYEENDIKVTVESDPADLDRVLEMFARYLMACSYYIDPKDELVFYDPETEYIIDADELAGLRQAEYERDELRRELDAIVPGDLT